MKRYALALAALTLALATSSCSDDLEPKIAGPTSGASAGTESSSATPDEPTTSATPSASPTEDSQTEDTAIAWLDALSAAFSTGEFEDVDRLTGAGCSTCGDLVDPVRTTFEQGGRYDADPIRVLSVEPQSDPEVVRVQVEFPAGELTESAGAEPSEFEASEDTLNITVKTKRNGKGVVSEVQFIG